MTSSPACGARRPLRRMTRLSRMARLPLPAVVLTVVLSGCAFFASSYAPNPSIAEAEENLATVATIREEERWIVLEPKAAVLRRATEAGEAPVAGIIFYPGGKVSPRSYLPLFREIVAEGYLVYIVKMPLDLAVMDVDRALSAIEAAGSMDRGPGTWHIVGHSLGGAMAAQLVDRNPEVFAGLTMLASYPAGGVDLTDDDVAVLSVYGTRDGVADVEAIQAAADQYPADAEFVAIAGANHAGFGVYGPQEDDLPATISGEEQRAVTQRAMLEHFRRIGG